MKKTLQIFGLIATLLLTTSSAFGSTFTYDFNSAADTAAWTYTVSKRANVLYTIASSHQGISSTGASDLFFAMSFLNKSGESLEMVSAASYSNISNITFDACATDNSKPNFSLIIVASDGTETTVINEGKTKDTFGSKGTKQWARGYSQTVNNLSGKIKFKMVASSSGKYAALDNIIVTYTDGGPTPPGPSDPSTDATLSDLKVNGTTIQGFVSSTTTYNVTLPAGTTTVPTVTATANNANASTPVITPASSLPGTTTVLVTAEDGTTTLTYSINFSVASSGGTDPVTPPSTDLSLHETEIYESPTIMGGYGGTLSTYNNREYEVYYPSYDNSSNLSLNINPVRKVAGITTSITEKHFKATDNWLEAEVPNGKSDYSMSNKEEFKAGTSAIHKLLNNGYYKMHIKGYDQFSFYGKDNNADASKNRLFEIYIDGTKQTATPSTTASIRRFDISTGEHVIEVRGVGSSNNEFYGFSLRVAYIPKVKYVSGNDSTQTVYQTANIRPVTYFIKNKIQDAELTWTGAEATGITLQAGNGDTIMLQGTANCPVGTYQYTISAKDNNGVVTSSMSGSFSVEQKVTCLTTNLLNMTVYEKTAITPVEFRCYVLNMGDVTPKWLTPQAPGLSFSTDPDKHKITLSGTPTTPGTYTYAVILGTDSILGSVTVESNSPTIVPGASSTLLFLYKSNKEDGILGYIKASRKYSYFARPAGGAMGAEAEYAQFNAIVISEDVDANNEEVLGIIRSLNKPVLNMKAFTYSKNRLNWGDPDNGSITNKKLTIQQRQHPIFGGTLAGKNDLTLLDSVAGNKGLMPIEVNNYPGTICLAAAPTRGDNYDDDGDYQTFIHEVPASMRGAKYLSYPISSASTAFLTADAKVLFDNMIAYLTNPSAQSVALPTLKIESLKADDVIGQIDEANKTITVQMPANTNLAEVRVELTLADATTHSTPESGSVVNFSDYHYGVTFTVSDYINVVKYTVKVLKPSDLEGIESDGLWFADETLHNNNGVWVNIFSVDGQLITTTNSEFSFAGMPRGLYLIRSANASLKIMH